VKFVINNIESYYFFFVQEYYFSYTLISVNSGRSSLTSGFPQRLDPANCGGLKNEIPAVVEGVL
jgi:hypothetical protein